MAIDRLFKDFNINLVARKDAARKMRDIYEREFGFGQQDTKALGDKFRRERHALTTMFKGQELNPALTFVLQVLDRRSARLSGPAQKLRSLAETGQLTTDLMELVSTLNHLHVNRLLRMEPRAHELVLYDFLYRLYDGELSRQGKSTKEVASDRGRDGFVPQ